MTDGRLTAKRNCTLLVKSLGFPCQYDGTNDAQHNCQNKKHDDADVVVVLDNVVSL